MTRRVRLLPVLVLSVVYGAGGLVLVGCGGDGEDPGGDGTVTVKRDRIVVWVPARGTVMAESNVTIAPPRWWRLKIAKIMVKEGETVKEGAVLMELDTENVEDDVRDRTRDIAAAEGALESARAVLRSERDRLNAQVNKFVEDYRKAKTAFEELKALPRETDLANARIDRDTTIKAAEQARNRYENMKQLYEKGGGVSLVQLEQRELEYRSADAEAKRAALVFTLVEAGPTGTERRDAELAMEIANVQLQQATVTRDLTIRQLEESVRKAEGRLEMNRGNLVRLKRIMDACVVRAPVSGTVFYGTVGTSEGREKIKEGIEVRPWDRLMELPDTSRMQIKVKVDEKDVGKVKLGQSARILLDAYRQQRFTGSVTRLEPVTQAKTEQNTSRDDKGREDLGTKIVEVVVTFNEQNSLIRTGLRGEVRIRTEDEADGLVIPKEALFTRDGRDVVSRIIDGRAVVTPVRVGARGEESVSIVSGLSEGDVVSLTAQAGEGGAE